MIRNIFPVITAIFALALAANAGSISGKVSGIGGVSVVYVDAIQGKSFPAPTEHPVIAQSGLVFQPHLTVVQAGTTVDFLNNDKVAHNVFWPHVVQGATKLPGKNLGTWPQGERRSYKFDQPGVAALLCNVHPEMSGYIVIVPSPYHATSDATGNYKIENVPDGQYKVTVWHEGAKATTKPVAVSGDSTADFTLSK